MPIRGIILVLLDWSLKNVSHRIMRILLRYTTPVLDLSFYITLLLMVLTWTAIQYPINIKSNLGIWTTNYLIPPMGAELIGG